VFAGGVGVGFAEGLVEAVADGLGVGLGVGLVAVGPPPQAIEPKRTRAAKDAGRLAIGGDYGL
jgi:hypothetical protein